MIRNLLINAMHGMDDIPRDWLDVRTYTRDRWVMIEIEDQGVGVPVDVLGRFFEPFYTTTGKDE